jgi:Family of unknown function (DUF6600)
MRDRLGAVNIRSTLVAPLALAFLMAIAGLSAFSGTAAAQDDAAQADPPGRVARLNFIQGSVSFQPAGTQDWIDASPNRPLTTGDNLWADQDARGELHVGSSVLRLSGQTGVSFLNLNDQITQLQLAQGSLYVRVRQLGEGEAFEIDTPNLAFSILRPGQYRVNVDPNGGSTAIDVWGGSGSATGGGQAFTLNPGQEFSFSGTDQLTYDAQPLSGRDDFDNWCFSRDQREDRSASARYLSRDVIGYDDLDDYGAWSNDPEYGPVWIPRGVAADWAPYHYGHWVFIAPWGWTWVEDEPWGFAPFHYGRWAVIGGAWGWVPGPVAVGVVVGGPVVRPMYAPALVGFVGGGGFSLSIAIGGGAGVAWFPLGPRDVWVPAYHCSPVYVQHVNVYNTRVVNVTQVTQVYNNVYVNRNTTVINHYTYENNVRAVTAVDRDTFVNGRPVGRASVRISQDQIQHPRVMEQTAVQPTQRSAFGGQANARVRPPDALANRRVVTKLAPAPNVVPIGHTQPLVRGNGGAPNNPAFGKPGNANAGDNAHPNNENNNARPGFRPFQPPNGNSNANGVGNAQPKNNNAQPTFQRPPQQNGNATGNSNPSGNQPFNRSEQPSNNVRPVFRPPSQNNGNTGNGNANSKPNFNRNNQPGNGAQPSNNVRPVFHPPSQNSGNTGNGNANSKPNFNRNNQPGNGAQPNNEPKNVQPTSRPPSHDNVNGGANSNVNRNANGNPHPSNNESNSRGGFQPPSHPQTEAKPPTHNNPPPKESNPPKKDEGKDHKDEQH